MQKKNPKGVIASGGRRFRVIYDIPDVHDRASGAAGGDVWFKPEDRIGLQAAAAFTLETAAGVEIEGAFIFIQGQRASVIVNPV